MGYFGKILRSYGSMPLVNNGLRDGKLPWATFVRNVMRVGLEETVTYTVCPFSSGRYLRFLPPVHHSVLLCYDPDIEQIVMKRKNEKVSREKNCFVSEKKEIGLS